MGYTLFVSGQYDIQPIKVMAFIYFKQKMSSVVVSVAPLE